LKFRPLIGGGLPRNSRDMRSAKQDSDVVSGEG
jgi:hypothetical protein